METTKVKLSEEEFYKKLKRSYVFPYLEYYYELKKLGYDFPPSHGNQLQFFNEDELSMFTLGMANGQKKFILIGNNETISIGDEENIRIAGSKEICPFKDGVYIPSTNELISIKE